MIVTAAIATIETTAIIITTKLSPLIKYYKQPSRDVQMLKITRQRPPQSVE